MLTAGKLALPVVAAAVHLAVACSGAAQESEERWRRMRDNMVRSQIEARGVRSPAVLDALRKVRREEFVPDDVRAFATHDSPLPIGQQQTISQPYIVALMTELLEVERHHRVLEIGTGSGYQTAVLAVLSDHVYSVELLPELAARAARILRSLGYTAPVVRQGDGYLGWPEHAPYDRIIVTAAPPTMPEALIVQLANGGRLVAPVGPTPDTQSLVVVTKDANGRVRRRRNIPVRFVPMVRAAEKN